MAATDDKATAVAEPEVPIDHPSPLLGKIMFWGLVAWVLGYCGVLLAAFSVQIFQGEFPCPLCMVQRYAMILSSLSALWLIMQARRNTLTPLRYAQGLGMAIVAAILGSWESIRQILLHIMPGDPGYGGAVMGLHLYTWALLTFVIVILYCGVALILAPAAVPIAPKQGIGAILPMIVVWLFVIVVAANVVAIILLEGFAWVLPDDPSSYNLIDQLTGK
ncbi:MAG: disulfide bond formation protein B [Candidatus Nanopelagicales bacterium]